MHLELELAPKQTIFGGCGEGGWVRYCLAIIFGSRRPERKHLLSKIQVQNCCVFGTMIQIIFGMESSAYPVFPLLSHINFIHPRLYVQLTSQ